MSKTSFIRNPTHPAWSAHSHHVKAMIGIKGELPAAGAPAQLIQGWQVYVRPLVGSAPAHGKRHTHRVIAVCPDCQRHISAGRTRQHTCKGA